MEQLKDMLAKKGSHVHMMGVCGIGMAGLAWNLKNNGFKVSGCDVSLNEIAKWLEAHDIDVLSGHNKNHILPAVDWVIKSAAVSEDDPEVISARDNNIPVFSRGNVLAEFLTKFQSVAVGGTHGKTTTSTFITQVLKNAGSNPSWCIGGESSLDGVAGGTDADSVFIAEADESDGTLAFYKPTIGVVTNVEFDHMEHFGGVDEFEECFRAFAESSGKLIFCADDPGAVRLFSDLSSASVSYGFSVGSEVRGCELIEKSSSVSFSIEYKRKLYEGIELPVPGRHNALNALAAVAVALELGLDFEKIIEGLGSIMLPSRRFEILSDRDDITVISDYAHHPTEIVSLMNTAEKSRKKRLLAVFQPHRYTRTLALGKDFPPAFNGVDELVLLPVYPASEKPLKGGTVYDLYELFLKSKEANLNGKVKLASSLEEAWRYFEHKLQPGDTLLVIGAGDVEKIAHYARDSRRDSDALLKSFAADHSSISPRLNEPLSGKTTIGVGGNADIYIEVSSVSDLGSILKWTHEHELPFKMLGGGSNLLISDLGVRGVVARLAGELADIQQDGLILKVGSAVPLSRLLSWLEDNGVGGFEFLEGIPGTVGGALRMNAGAFGCELGKYVSWVRCLNKDGSECMVEKEDLKLSYRNCESLADKIVIEAGLQIEPGTDVSKIKVKRKEIAEKRAWMKGARSAGSIFKNPESGEHGQKSAGELIDEAGLKGLTVGGAKVSEQHGNIIVASKEACSSDVKALIEKIRCEVKDRFDIYLKTEIVEFN